MEAAVAAMFCHDSAYLGHGHSVIFFTNLMAGVGGGRVWHGAK
jgi:hypothetical protein